MSEGSSHIARSPRPGGALWRAAAILVATLFAAPVHAAEPVLAWVLNQHSASMSVIDTATQTVVETVSLAGIVQFPDAVALTPDGTHLYVTDHVGQVVVLKTGSYAVAATIPLGAHSDLEDIAITPDGSLAYVTARNTQTVVAIDTATNTIAAEIPVGQLPSRVVFSPDGAFAYVVEFGSHSISVINAATHTVAAAIPMPGIFPNDIALASVGGNLRAYVTLWGGSQVAVIDLATNAVVGTVFVGGAWTLEASVDGSFIAVAQWSVSAKGLSIIDTSTDTVVSTLPFTVEQANIKLTPDAAYAYMTDFSGNLGLGQSVFVVDLAANNVVAQLPVELGPFGMAIGVPNLETNPPPSNPATRADCQGDGWQSFGFSNQGRCIQFVNTGKNSR